MRLAGRRQPEGVDVLVEYESTWVPVGEFDPGIRGLAEAYRRLDALEDAVAAKRAAGHDADWARSHDPGDVHLAPCVVPGAKILAVGLNFADHVSEVGLGEPADPYVFVKTGNALNGPYDGIRVPHAVTAELDYEIELAVVIGRRVTDVSVAEADAAIAGYMVANDVSAREWQRTQPWPQMVKAKCLDGFLPIGPWLTTRREVPDPGHLTMECRVNGELRQQSNTHNMIHDPATLVSFLSAGLTLEPGDIILSGTPSGSAFARDGQPWLTPGDRVRCTIEGLGHIENVVG